MKETGFTMDSSSIRFGAGMTGEVGWMLRQLGCTRVLVVTDRQLAASESVSTATRSLRQQGIDAVMFDGVRIEPTDVSLGEAIRFATDGDFDGYLAVGGGSVMDTAKAANLYATYPAPFLDYVNAPIGGGKPVPGPVMPLIAVPTTAGTGSETTGTIIFDLTSMHTKTGIAHRALRPIAGVIDPENTRTLPPMAAASTGLDVLSHAIESYTALPYHERDAPEEPGSRPAYQGANPISDIWSERSISMVAAFLEEAVNHPDNERARGAMLLAATYAGIGFGNAGVHLPHGMSYPVSGMVRDYVPEGYADDHPIIPHGMSVILHTPAVVRFTAPADPDRHLRVAQLMGRETEGVDPAEAGNLLADTIIDLMKRVGVPNGLAELGFTADDIDRLVDGTLPQHRVTKLSPIAADETALSRLFRASMRIW